MAISFTRFANTDTLGPTIFNRLGDELVQDIEDVLDGTEAMASPAVTSFVQSQHNHQNGAGGGQISAAAMSASGITDLWVLSAVSGQGEWRDANAGGTPAGGGALWFGSASPSGWLLCDGRTVNRQAFSALFNAIGTQYNTGGESSSDFRLPDTRGRVLMGLDNMGGTSANRVTATVADTLGGSGGAENHTLLEAELAVHHHSIATAATSSPGTDPGEDVNYSSGGREISTNAETSVYPKYNVTGSKTHPYNDPDRWPNLGPGGTQGSPHNNLQPFMAINLIIKT